MRKTMIVLKKIAYYINYAEIYRYIIIHVYLFPFIYIIHVYTVQSIDLYYYLSDDIIIIIMMIANNKRYKRITIPLDMIAILWKYKYINNIEKEFIHSFSTSISFCRCSVFLWRFMECSSCILHTHIQDMDTEILEERQKNTKKLVGAREKWYKNFKSILFYSGILSHIFLSLPFSSQFVSTSSSFFFVTSIKYVCARALHTLFNEFSSAIKLMMIHAFQESSNSL